MLLNPARFNNKIFSSLVFNKYILSSVIAIDTVFENELLLFWYFTGLGTLLHVLGVTVGTVDDCVTDLRHGNLLCVAPGGVREALFSDSRTYSIMWAKRLGFAKIALEAQVVSGF